MNDKHSVSDTELNELYQARKRKVKSPGSIKRRILAHEEPIPVQKWFQRLGGFTVAASLLVLMSLMNVTLWDGPDVSTPIDYQARVVHTLSDKPDSPRESINSRYAEHYKQYLDQQALFAQHHTRPARLILRDGGWELKTCDEELLSISQELVAALKNIDQIDEVIRPGDPVDILFDRTGIILGIKAAESPMMCS